MSRQRDRQKLALLLHQAWATARHEAEAAGASLDRWDLCDSVLDLVAAESAEAAFYDELRRRWLERARERRVSQVRQTQQAVCVVCGATFRALRSDARYCRPACRQRAHRERHRPRE
jgi:3-methyladenine DNA glycosylase AlkD